VRSRYKTRLAIKEEEKRLKNNVEQAIQAEKGSSPSRESGEKEKKVSSHRSPGNRTGVSFEPHCQKWDGQVGRAVEKTVFSEKEKTISVTNLKSIIN